MWFFSTKGQFLLSPLALTAPSSKSITWKRASFGATASFVLFQGHFRVCTKRKGLFYSPWQLQSHSEDRRGTIHQTEDMIAEAAEEKAFSFLAGVRALPSCHRIWICFLPKSSTQFLRHSQSSGFNNSLCLLPALILGKGKAGSWRESAQLNAFQGPQQQCQQSGCRATAHFLSTLLKTAVLYHLCLQCSCAGGIPQAHSTASTWCHPDISLRRCCATGRISGRSKAQPAKGLLESKQGSSWQVQPCWRAGRAVRAVIKSCGWALCQGLTLQKGLSLRGALQILLQVL